MAHFLVLTAIGTDRTGIVSELTTLASECGCNIDDSRMAIFGNEFTFIMLLSGALTAITQIENRLPPIAHSLELITMMKRTTNHKTRELTQHFEVSFSGPDASGLLKQLTTFFAKRNIDLSSLKSVSNPEQKTMMSNVLISLTPDTSIEDLNTEFVQFCQDVNMQGNITKIEHTINY